MFHILVVDDDKNTRLLLKAVLENANYNVTTAVNGEDALGVLRANVSKIDATEKLLDRFEQIGARVIGFILNGSVHKKQTYKQYKEYEQHNKR